MNIQAGDERGRGRRGRGRQGYERSLAMDTPDTTITLLTQRHKYSRASKNKGPGEGGAHELVTPHSQDSQFCQNQTFWLLRAGLLLEYCWIIVAMVPGYNVRHTNPIACLNPGVWVVALANRRLFPNQKVDFVPVGMV